MVDQIIPEQVEISGIKINKDLTKGPYFVDGKDTLAKLWKLRCEQLKDKIAHREKKYGIWSSFSWNNFYNNSRLIGLALMSMGLKRGEVVSILSEDSKEWIYTDLAVQSVGGITSGVYPTDSARQLVYLVNDSDTQFLFLENDEHKICRTCRKDVHRCYEKIRSVEFGVVNKPRRPNWGGGGLDISIFIIRKHL